MTQKFVVHCRSGEYFDVYIGRPSRWGNPYNIGEHGTREEVIAKFAASLSPEKRAEIQRELKGKILGCWCKPHHCHGDVLAEIANAETLENVFE